MGNQLELAYLTGVKISSTPLAVDINQLFNGFEYNALSNGGHVLDGTTVFGWSDRFISTAKLNKLIKSIPPKYRTQNMDYRYLVSPNVYTDFAELVGARPTPGGDIAYTAAGYETNFPAGTNSRLGWAGFPIYTVPLLPESEFVAKVSGASTTVASGGAAGATTVVVASAAGLSTGKVVQFGSGATKESKTITNVATATLTLDSPFSYVRTAGDAVVEGSIDGSFAMLAHFLNLIVGIQRDIRIELDRRPRERATYAVVTLRSDCTVENPDSMGILTGLAVK